MNQFDRAFQNASRKLARAAGQTMDEMVSGALPDEPSVTAGLVTRLRDALNRHRSAGITWSAKVLSSHGPHTEEKKYGADFLGVLNLDLPDYKVAKGFLAQAKRQEPGSTLSTNEWARLQDQCTAMLGFSAESFVFVYALNGVFVVPAVSVVAASTRIDLHTLHPRRLGRFYEDHFRCFVGDRRLDSATAVALAKLTYQSGLAIDAVPEQDRGVWLKTRQ